MNNQPLQNSAPSQIPALTSIRGVLAFWVVIYHFWNDLILLFPFCEYLTPIVINGHLAVPAFFILSGTVLSLNYFDKFEKFSFTKYKSFLQSRLARIYPLHLFTLFIVLLMVIVSIYKKYDIDFNGYTPVQFLENLFLIQTWDPNFVLNWNYPSWSISSEWFAYLAFPVFIFLLKPVRKSLCLSIVVGIILLSLSTYWLQIRSSLPCPELLLVIPTFASGIVIQQIAKKITNSSLSKNLAITAYLAPAVLTVFYLPSHIARVSFFLFGISFLFLLFLNSSHLKTFWNTTFLVSLGESSYSLYMTHTLAQKILYKLLPVQGFEGSTFVFKFGIVLLYAALIFALSFASFYLIEKPFRIKFHKTLKKLN